jgi:hypothetical protein
MGGKSEAVEKLAALGFSGKGDPLEKKKSSGFF